jgi:hypothetical protein
MRQPTAQYVSSFQTEHIHQRARYHWMVCREHKPDELVSWGHSATQEKAEMAAQSEVTNLSLGLTQGGRVTSTVKTFVRRRLS